MPLLILLGIGGATFFFADTLADKVIKWTVVGGIAYVGLKKLDVI